ncbi:MAG: universal stress protein [Polyangiales bacterium]
MHLPKTILVPTDFSTCAEQAVQYGLKLAKQLDARAYLMTAWTMPYSRWDEQRESPHDVPPQLEAAAKAALEARLLRARKDFEGVEALFYIGDTTDSILKAAADVEADIIVVGTHGRKGLARMFEGSVTEAVTRRAVCPVLAIRYRVEEASAVPARSGATR